MLRNLPLKLKPNLTDFKFLLRRSTHLLHAQSKPTFLPYHGRHSNIMTSHVNKLQTLTSHVNKLKTLTSHVNKLQTLTSHVNKLQTLTSYVNKLRTSLNTSRRTVTTSNHTSLIALPLSEPVQQQPCTLNLHCVPRACPGERPNAATLCATVPAEARLDHTARRLIMEWNNGEVTEYPYAWLRDNCQCELCFDEGPCARRLLINEIDLINSTPVDVQTDGTAQQVELSWSDGHKSVYRYKWLQDRSFEPTRQARRARWHARSPRQLWDASFINNIPTLSFDRLIKDKHTQYEWITLLEEVGFVLLKGAPLEMGQIGKIAQQIGFLRKTSYGDTCKICAKNNPSNVAFTSNSLMLHTDLAFNTYIPGMQMMHCIEQAAGEGGKNLFVDGFLVANQLKEKHPDQFKILTDTVLDFYDIGTDFIEYHQMSRHPVIRLDEEGNLLRIAYSSHGRDSYLRLPLESVEPFYKALNTFTNLLYHPSNLVPLKLQPGDISCFDNWRILHGRLGYNAQAGETRFLEHGYIDWDEMHSKRRVLKSKLGIPDEEY